MPKNEIDREAILRRVMDSHIGRPKKIGMGELFEAVYGEPWRNKINDSRPLRKLINQMQRSGYPIVSDSDGYYLASAGSEMADYCERRLQRPALRKLDLAAKLRRMTLAELVGQLRLDLGD